MAAVKKRTRKKTKKRTQKEKQPLEFGFQNEILLWILLAVSILLFVGNFGIGGKVGSFASSISFGLFGLMAYVFPILLFFGSCFLISNKKNHFAFFKFFASILLFCSLCMFLQLIVQDKGMPLSSILKNAYAYSSSYKIGGGFLGAAFICLCLPSFGAFGSFVIDFIAMAISLVLLTERSLFLGMKHGSQKIIKAAKEEAKYRENRQKEQTDSKMRRIDKKIEGVALDTEIPKKRRGHGDALCEILPEKVIDFPKAYAQEEVFIEPADSDFVPESEMPLPEIYIEPADSNFVPESEMPLPEIYIEPIEDEIFKIAEEKERKEAKIEEKKERPAAAKAAAQEKAVSAAPAQSLQNLPGPYIFPDVSLLKQGDASKTTGDSKMHLRATANKLQQTLKNFGVNVTITNISSGPSVTRYEIQPEMGVKVSKIVGLTDDIKLNLAATDIRMEAPIPGKAAIGIEIPNKENVTVMFRDLIESDEFKEHPSKIAFAAGKDIAGKVIVTDIAKMPHLLIAGATGSGKSVCINTIIMSILFKAHPDDVKLIMIDPKVVELSVYNEIPHLMIPVVTDPKKAAGALNWAVAEMEDRYQKFAECGVRDLNGYNAKIAFVPQIEGEVQKKRLPQIVIIVDELADLMMVASNEVETAICRLAQLARAAGLHLIIATQRPSVNVITGLIKANMPSRVAFAVTSGVDSRTILDMTGAEKLLGKGDMLFFPQNYQKPLRVQGAFVSDQEVSDVTGFIKNQNRRVPYNAKIQEKIEQSENISVSISKETDSPDGRDSLFYEVGKFLIESEKGSIGSIQRKFKVGFNRAARIVDQLEEAGLLGPEEGTKARKVLMTQEEFEESFRINQ